MSGEGGNSRPMRSDLRFPRSIQPKRRAESMASSIIGQSEDAPGSLLGWDIEVTDHSGGTVLLMPISNLQQNMKRKHADCPLFAGCDRVPLRPGPSRCRGPVRHQCVLTRTINLYDCIW